MPVKYDYDPESHILHARPYGKIAITDILGYFDAGAEDTDIPSGVIEVVHFDNVEDFLFSSDNAGTVPEKNKQLKDRKKIRGTIFVAGGDIQFGISRMFQILFEINDITENVIVVRTEDEVPPLIKKIRG